jgi:hypothetical protein
MPTRRELRLRLRSILQSAQAAAQLPVTPRETLLAVSEYARRLGGDVPALVDLAGFELKVFSQNGEDGVIAEIARRSGAPGQFFVEIGAGFGVENNCAALADLAGWSGLFIEAGEREFAALAHKYRPQPRVRVAQSLVTPENVDDLLSSYGAPAEPDVLTIDVDGSDYWIWEALERHRPRIVVIEYNGSLEPGRRLVQPRDSGPWSETGFYGASIDALVSLGARKGYKLVHCDLTGNNAFFVRDDLPGSYLEDVPRRATNLWLAGVRHEPDSSGREYVDLDA